MFLITLLLKAAPGIMKSALWAWDLTWKQQMNRVTPQSVIKKTKSDTEGNQNNHIHILQAFCSKERTAKVELEASRVSFPSGRRRDLEDTIQLMTTRKESTKHLLDVIQHVCCTADAGG